MRCRRARLYARGGMCEGSSGQLRPVAQRTCGCIGCKLSCVCILPVCCPLTYAHTGATEGVSADRDMEDTELGVGHCLLGYVCAQLVNVHKWQALGCACHLATCVLAVLQCGSVRRWWCVSGWVPPAPVVGPCTSKDGACWSVHACSCAAVVFRAACVIHTAT
jgi:hypothetical protein